MIISLKSPDKSNIFNQRKGLNNISVIFASYKEIGLQNSFILQEFKMQKPNNQSVEKQPLKKANARNIKGKQAEKKQSATKNTEK